MGNCQIFVLERELVVLVFNRRRFAASGLAGRFVFRLIFGVLLAARKEVDVRGGQVKGRLGRTVLADIRSSTELSGDGNGVALMQVLLRNFAKLAPSGDGEEIGDLVAIRILDAGIGGEAERTTGSAGALLARSGFGSESANGNKKRHTITPLHTCRRVS